MAEITISLGDLSDKALETIRSREDGILQSELKKVLGIESSKCSKVVSRLEKAGFIQREKAVLKGSRTYLIKPKVKARERAVSVTARKTISSPIDSYLTEIYLLYLIRGSTN